MKISQKGIDLIKHFEGVKLNAESFKAVILPRGWSRFQEQEETYVSLYYMDI